jgi:glutamine synthetase
MAGQDFIASMDTYGTNVFKGAVADKYLEKHGLPKGFLNDPSWTRNPESANTVARAVLDWAKDRGASIFTHWFQPQGSTGVRLGLSGQVHNALFTFNKDGQPEFSLKGKDLLRGETDGSSFPSGGLRATHTAGGYTVLDPTSPLFIRGDTVYAPTVFFSYHGDALDEKTPLLRSVDALSRESKRLCGLLGWKIDGAGPNIGLEQEFFLVPRTAYYQRPDLQLAGRTVMGKHAPRGQEMSDHYMGPLNQVAMKCLQEIQHECFLVGIPMKTRHREVAPNQYECAPMFGTATTQIDQNILFMQICEEVAARHGLAALFQEKPFAGINGSGKHNNFSIGTPSGVNFLNPEDVTEASGTPDTFAVIMSAIIRAVDKHGDLMRMAIASPGNDFRLGACEAPPAIVSTYLGKSLTTYLENFKSSKTVAAYSSVGTTVDLGVASIPPFSAPAEDRNRTSPFPYGGHRFEFRAVGSSQNVSMVNTVLCTAIAESMATFSAAIEAGKKPLDVAAAALDEHWRVIFNGNGYAEDWPVEAEKRGIWRIDSGVEAIGHLASAKNVALFEGMKVLSAKECEARANVMWGHYAGSVEIEALAMVDMINQHVIPSCKDAGLSTEPLTSAVASVKTGLGQVHAAASEREAAVAARVLRLETMESARKACDEVEAVCPPAKWTLATYRELLFLDATAGAQATRC